MIKEEPIFEYMKKVKNITEFLARGNEIETGEKTVINFDRSVAKEFGSISLEEVSLIDTLESKYYNELGSVKRLVELINRCDYDEYEKIIEPFINKPIKNEEVSEEYETIKNRVKEILNKIVLQIYMGLRVKLTEGDFAMLNSIYLQEKTADEDIENNEIEYPDEIEYEEYEEFEDENGNENEEKINQPKYLIYSLAQNKFYVIQENEVLLENINVDLAMKIIMDYLYEEEKDRKTKELENGKIVRTNLEYAGMYISLDEGNRSLDKENNDLER